MCSLVSNAFKISLVSVPIASRDIKRLCLIAGADCECAFSKYCENFVATILPCHLIPREQVFIPPGEVHLDRLEQEDVFTFNVEFDSDGNPDLNKEATSPCHNISAYTHLFLRIFQVSSAKK